MKMKHHIESSVISKRDVKCIHDVKIMTTNLGSDFIEVEHFELGQQGDDVEAIVTLTSDGIAQQRQTTQCRQI